MPKTPAPPTAPAWLNQVQKFDVPGLDVGTGDVTHDPETVGKALATIADAMTPKASEPVAGDPQKVRLTRSEMDWLAQMAVANARPVSRLMDKPPIRVMNSLVRKGLVKDIMSTFWEITDAGRKRSTTIY
ncbi:hypothetical protein ACOTC5_30195 [Achromobacter xylosoxidans]